MQYRAGCRVNIYQKLREVHHLFLCCYGTIWRQENVLGTCRTINAIFGFDNVTHFLVCVVSLLYKFFNKNIKYTKYEELDV